MKNIDESSLHGETSLQYEIIDDLVEAFLQRCREGRAVTIDQFADEHPKLSREIRELFPTLMQMENLGKGEDSAILSRNPSSRVRYDSSAEYEPPGSKIDAYTVVTQLGEGGFGIVYKVEQSTPIHRLLAMKIVKPGMNSDELLSRFNAERQALAILDHPNISKIIDAGATTSGRPYFVMELVEGMAITQHAENRNLSIRDRLKLMIDVCDGVHHAHQRGIIHRDLKPTNLLVATTTERDVVKIIDFGMAKVISSTFTTQHELTKISQIVGTPLYMSPEQACFGTNKLDTRSDIYSLGVILYELLTGATPLSRERLADLSPTELQRALAEDSTKSPRLINRAVSLDLETIALKALAKLPDDRYQSASDLARDLQLFLDDLPIHARRISGIERTVRWCRRKPALAGLTFSVVVMTLGFVIMTFASNYRIRQETKLKSVAIEGQSIALALKNEALDRLRSSLKEAERLKTLAFQRYYATQMNLACQSWLDGETTRAADLLRSVMPNSQQIDVRGFEWHYLNSKIYEGLLQRISIPREEIIDLAFSPEGDRILVVGGTPHTGFAKLYETKTGKQLVQLHHESDYVNGCAYSPHGDRFAIATGNGFVKIFDADTFEPIHSEQLPFSAKSMAWSPDGQSVALGTETGDLRVWSLPDFRAIDNKRAHSGPILRVRFSNDSRLLYSNADWGGEGVVTKIWSTEESNLVEKGALNGYSFFRESSHVPLLACSKPGTVCIVRSDDHSVVRDRFISSGSFSGIEFAPDNASIFLGCRTERSVYELDAETLQPIRRLPSFQSVQALAMNAKANLLAAGDAAGETLIWKLDKLDENSARKFVGTKRVEWLDEHQGFLLSGGPKMTFASVSNTGQLSFDGDRSKVVLLHSASIMRNAQLVSANEQVLIRTLVDKNKHYVEVIRRDKDQKPFRIPIEGQVFQKCLAVSPSGRWLAFRALTHPLHVFDLTADQPNEVFTLPGEAYDIQFTPNESQLVSCGQYGVVEAIDLTNLRLLPKYSDTVALWTWSRAAAFSRDGKYLAVSGDSGDVRVWEVATQNQIAVLKGQAAEVESLAFFPDNERLAVGGKADVRVWNFQLEQELMQLPTVDLRPISMAVDRGGDKLVAVLWNGTVQMWDSQEHTPGFTNR